MESFFIDLVQFGCCLNIRFPVWILWCVMKNSRDNYPQFPSEIIKTWKDEMNFWNSCRSSTAKSGKDPVPSFFPSTSVPIVDGGNFHRFMWKQKRKIFLWKCTISVGCMKFPAKTTVPMNVWGNVFCNYRVQSFLCWLALCSSRDSKITKMWWKL